MFLNSILSLIANDEFPTSIIFTLNEPLENELKIEKISESYQGSPLGENYRNTLNCLYDSMAL